MTEPFDENSPLSEDELQRLEHNALAMVAREFMTSCPQCEAEAPLIVRAVVELRRRREAVFYIGEPMRHDTAPVRHNHPGFVETMDCPACREHP